MLRVAMKKILCRPLIVRPLGVMARRPSPTPPMEIIDIDMDTMDCDYLKNKEQPPLIIGGSEQRRVWRPALHIDGFSTGLQIDDSQRGQSQWQVEKEEKKTDK